MNPGPSSSSNENTIPITASIDSIGRVLNVYGAGGRMLNGQTFCANIGASFIYEQLTYPSGVAPSGSVGNNGALTLGTALDYVYGPTGISPGIWLYFPTGAVYAGSLAGSYWCVMTSTTLGTIYNNILPIPGEDFPPTTPYPVIATGPGAYTGVTTEVPVKALTIFANSVGEFGNMNSDALWSFNNTANAKTARLRFGGITGTIYESLNGINNSSALSKTDIYCRATNYQIGGASIAYGLNASPPIASAVDMTQDVVKIATVQLATATDWMIMQTWNLMLRKEFEASELFGS